MRMRDQHSSDVASRLDEYTVDMHGIDRTRIDDDTALAAHKVSIGARARQHARIVRDQPAYTGRDLVELSRDQRCHENYRQEYRALSILMEPISMPSAG